ncbi:MAG: RebB like protein [Kordia sp.]|nr:MAG: RebB like protein [Kordia sp.]
MAFPTSVNDQITDSVTQSSIAVISNAGPLALSSLYQVLSSSLSLAIQNAVTNQQQLNTIGNAATVSCVDYLLNTTNNIKK